MTAYYNENSAYPAQWLRNLIDAGLIAPGDVDERSIEDVRAADLVGYTQCHFFAGVGVWSHALRLSGWPDDRPVVSGSCPCQPWSKAGKGLGADDPRHLWPAWHRLIRELRPDTIFGEQVAGQGGFAWFDSVSADLEADRYAVGAVDIPACGFGAPHIRNRLFFVANAGRGSVQQRRGSQLAEAQSSVQGNAREQRLRLDVGDGEQPGSLAHAPNGNGRAGVSGTETGVGPDTERGWGPASGGVAGVLGDSPRDNELRVRESGTGGRGTPRGPSAVGVMGHTSIEGPQRHARDDNRASERPGPGGPIAPATIPGPVNGFWSGAEWVRCSDGKARPHGPESFPLAVAPGAAESLGRIEPALRRVANSNKTGRLKGYGNSLTAPAAEAFIRSYMECRPTNSWQGQTGNQ